MKPSIEINIGIVGSSERINLVKEVLSDFPNIKPFFLIEEAFEVDPSAMEELSSNVEAILFTDYYTCQSYRSNKTHSNSIRYIPVTTSGLYVVLFKNRDALSMANLSLDTISTHDSMSIIDDLKTLHINILPAPKNLTKQDDILEFHKSNYEKSKAIIFTAIPYVQHQLSILGIPSELIPLTQLDIVNALERTLLSTQTRLDNESQTIVGIVKPDKDLDSTQSQKLKRIIGNYVDSIDGYLINSNDEFYTFVSTRGVFERESRGYKFLPLLHESKSSLGIGLSIGVGFGYTALAAGKHANLAFTQSSDAGGNVCYIVREDQSVFGPVASTAFHAYDKYQITITNPSLLEQAEKMGMSASYMNKIMSRVSRHNQLEYTANDLAEILDITLRSANRILLKWIDIGLVSIIGEEKPTRHGRPRRVYRLNFIEDFEQKEKQTL